MREIGELGAAEKREYCERLTSVLAELRKRLGRTQDELEVISGISRITLSQIESGRSKMSWLHFAALMLVFSQYRETKELLYLRSVLDERLLRAYQHRLPTEPLDFSVKVEEERMLFRRSALPMSGEDGEES